MSDRNSQAASARPQLNTVDDSAKIRNSGTPYSLLGIGSALALYDDDREVANFIASALTAALEVKLGAAALLKEDDSKLHVFGQLNADKLPNALIKEIENFLSTSPKISEARLKENFYEMKVGKESLPKLRAKSLSRLLMIRLRTLDQDFGVALVGKSSDEPFSPEQKSTLEMLASQASSALHRIQLNKERDASEAALRESEEQYRSFYNETPVMMHSINRNAQLVNVNHHWLKTLGYQYDEVIGRKVIDFMTPVSRQHALKSGLLNAFKTGSLRDIELQFAKKDGEVIDVLLSATAKWDEQGQFDHSLAFLFDITARKRKQAEKALRESEERYRTLYNHTPVMMHEIDSDGCLTNVNDYWLEVLGYERSEVIGKRLPEFMTEASRRYAKGVVIPKLFKTGYVRDVEYQFVKKNGEVIDALLSAISQWDKSRKMSHAVAFIVDVTERKQAERALEESEERYRTLYNHTPVMMHEIDSDGCVTNVNDYWLEVLGYERSEVIGKPGPGFLTEASRRYAKEVVIPKVFKTGYVRDAEYQFVRKNGEVIDVLLSAISQWDKSRKMSHALAFIVDVTERKQAERALQESEERYRDLYDKAPLAYFSVGQDGRIRMANIHATELLGYVREDLVGRLLFDLYADTPDGKRRAKRIFQRFVKGEEPEGEELQMRKADGSLVWISLTVRAIRDEQGEILESRSMAVDITERRQAETELQKYAEELAHSNADLESFSYSVSHDLRAPLRAIDGFSRILLEDYSDKLDSECNRLLNIIRNNTQNMGQLIDDLLLFSRLGRTEMQFTEINLEGLVKSVFNELKATTEEQNINLNIKKLPSVTGDRSMIRQVFVNLISNAIKFTRPKKTAVIEVGSKVEENSSVYYVKDNGVGFEMQYVDKLFGVFQRLHTAEEFEGTGVGLALVQRIIRRHGGRVSAEGKVNKGATIYFTLPKKGG